MSQSVFINGGFSSTDKVPGPYGEVAPASGAISAASIPIKVLSVGLKTSDGSAVVEQDIVPIGSANDAIVAFGQRSQLTNMLLSSLAQGEDIELFGMAVAEPSSSPVAASLTVTFAVTSAWTSPITYVGSIAGKDITFSIPVNATPAQIATSFAAAINGAVNAPNLPVVATATGAATTITVANLGTTGNAYLYFEDKSQAAGLGTTIAGGTAVTAGGVPFAGGLGTENVTNALSVLYNSQYERIAIGQIDATNLGLWRTQLAAQAMPTEGHLQQLVCGTNGSYATATTTATTTLNNSRMEILQLLNSETMPWELAAGFAAIRAANEQDDPDASYDGVVIKGARPQRAKADKPSHSQKVALLNNGVTPLTTTHDGNIVVVRAITSRSLNGSIPDYRMLDVSQQTVPDFVLTDLKLLWTTEYLPANPRVQDDPPNENTLPTGVATPSGWQRKVTAYLIEKAGETDPIVVAPTAATMPKATWNQTAQCIQLICPVVPSPNQHQVLISVRPTAYAA